MRSLRVGIAALIGVAVFFVPSAASAQVASVSVGTPRLGPEGATLEVPVTVVCDVGINITSVNVTVDQSTGQKLATGIGFVTTAFPGTPCTGGPQTMTVPVRVGFSSFAFKQGKATVTGGLNLFDPDPPVPTGVFESFGPITTRIAK